jgi:hypothetical protein
MIPPITRKLSPNMMKIRDTSASDIR